MTKRKLNLFFFLFLFLPFGQTQSEQINIAGLNAPVEIIVDEWGVPHIYAQNEEDLFFAQGYNAARDRLFQLEVWRRQATGTVAELLGPRELKRDIGTRLFQFRGDLKQEMNHYHERGALIITAFTNGVNAYIDQVLKDPTLLPMEFKLLNTKPQKWTPEVVISRHQGLLGNIGDELEIGRLVALVGAEKAKNLSWFHPGQPQLEIDAKINKERLFDDILELYNAYRRPLRFQPEDLIASVQTPWEDYRHLAQVDEEAYQQAMKNDINTIGSNNWIVNGDHTLSGYPIMANDPHRSQAAPSLRYITHLVAPGWNVIGGGEPEIPGISIGHNEHGAWGLTVFGTDAEDLYVYQLNPQNPDQYWYKGAWENMRVIKETIPVKGQKNVVVDLKYTRHGPVTFQDETHHIAYAIRCGWLEIGGSPYLASLRMNQSENFEEFRAACNYSNIPGENMIWADRAGNIGWQTVGIAPIRRHWSGLVPVPGDGSYEWDGYLPIIAKPNVYNPPSGMFYTANANVTPNDFPYMDAIGFSWSDPYRQSRLAEMLNNGRRHSLMDMASYQTDYLSIPARQIIPLLKPLQLKAEALQKAQQLLLDWDFQLQPHSIAAGIYNAWEKSIRDNMEELLIPEKARPYASLQMKKIIDHLVLPDGQFGEDPIASRDALLIRSLEEAIAALQKKLGMDMNKWQYGQAAYKHVTLKHPMSNALKADLRSKFDVGPAPRGGNSQTVNNTSSNDNQSHGASFRIIVDTGDWDACLAANTPGQSGNPDHPHYRNLFDLWAKDRYFPLFFSKTKVESVLEYRINLVPN
ncbi:MAG: penicillin acylase family protein [Saprospiraceae bacterium]